MIDNEIDLSGKTLGTYQIINQLGRGGMAVVYKAHESSLNRIVALKVLSTRLSQDAEYIARFEREARAAARLSHPNIVQIYAIGQEQGVHYFSMEYIKGRPLSALKKEQGKLSSPEALALIKQVAVALGAAHRAGLVHRDIKPSNIMVDSLDQVKVTDFGIAYVSGEQTKLTREGSIIGTPEYLSPEQCEGKQLDGRSDIYSLGVTLYELLTGRTPYEADTPVSMLMKILKGNFPPISQVNPDIPAPVVKIVEKMMQTDPNKRYDDVSGLIADLERVERELTGARDMSIPAPAATTASADTKKRNRNRALTVAAVIVLLMGGAFAARLIRLEKQEAAPRELVQEGPQTTVETTSFDPGPANLNSGGEETPPPGDGDGGDLEAVSGAHDPATAPANTVAGEDDGPATPSAPGNSPQMDDTGSAAGVGGAADLSRGHTARPRPTSPPAPPANSVVLITMGDEDKADLLESLIQARLADDGFKIVDGPSLGEARLAGIARYRLVTSVKLLGITTLEYYGSSSEMFTVGITLKLISTADGSIVVGPSSTTVKYTAIDADDKLREAVDRLTGDLKSKLNR